MLNPMLITMKAKKLGVLLRDARIKKNRSTEECASALGVDVDTFEEYEMGQRSPSLPELEILSFSLDIPIEHFLSQESLWQEKDPNRVVWLEQLYAIRQRTIGAMIRKGRLDSGVSQAEMAEHIGLTPEELDAIETGQRNIQMPHLEVICDTLGLKIEDLLDRRGPTGRWAAQKQYFQGFTQLPLEVQDFIAEPNNLPFLEAAIRLSKIPSDRLHDLAESLESISQ
jgi:transcriptional regulator with XRE-family HTH domain